MPRQFRLTVLLSLVVVACGRAPTPGLARGEALYVTCSRCHGTLGQGDLVLAAPAIGGLPTWYVEEQLTKFAAGQRGYHAFDTAGIRMKSVSWTLDREGDISSVAQYVATLDPGRPAAMLQADATAGASDYAVCSACHGQQGEGNEALHAPPLAGQSDWYLLAQLQKFHSGARGARPEDIWGQVMRPQAMMLVDSTGSHDRMRNVVAYIQTLGTTTAAR